MERIKVRFGFGQNDWVTVPQTEWDTLLNALTPALLETNPQPWEVVATVQLSLSEQRTSSILIFHCDNEPDAFRWRGRYYRTPPKFDAIKFFSKLAERLLPAQFLPASNDAPNSVPVENAEDDQDSKL